MKRKKAITSHPLQVSVIHSMFCLFVCFHVCFSCGFVGNEIENDGKNRVESKGFCCFVVLFKCVLSDSGAEDLTKSISPLLSAFITNESESLGGHMNVFVHVITVCRSTKSNAGASKM